MKAHYRNIITLSAMTITTLNIKLTILKSTESQPTPTDTLTWLGFDKSNTQDGFIQPIKVRQVTPTQQENTKMIPTLQRLQ